MQTSQEEDGKKKKQFSVDIWHHLDEKMATVETINGFKLYGRTGLLHVKRNYRGFDTVYAL